MFQDVIYKRLSKIFKLTEDLIQHLNQDSLSLKLASLPSNKIGEQFWCIEGARESYLKAAQASKWVGFSCSLNNINSKPETLESLQKSSLDILNFIASNKLSSVQLELFFDLLEHELTHHGQLIRFIYGNKLSFPQTWNKRYTV